MCNITQNIVSQASHPTLLRTSQASRKTILRTLMSARLLILRLSASSNDKNEVYTASFIESHQ
uniref:Uncharacterized protein n=1 Tax=Arion vulgaris TaxID=1028688 RepID=A0A0B6XYZ3_9EUPU